MSPPDDDERTCKDDHTDSTVPGRELPPGADGTVAPTGSEDAFDGDGLLERRSYLKLIGAAAVAGSTAAGSAAAAESYDTVTVPAGTIKRYDLASGETLRNKLFDVSADGAGVKIVPNGSDWLVENVGIQGQFDAKTFLLIPRVDGGGRGVIRNVYATSYGTNGGGVWVQPSHAGELVIENVWLEGFPNNGVYGSAPGKHDNPGLGRVVIRDSVGCNNNVSQFRTGSPDGLVENCAMWYDKTPEGYPLTDAGVTARGVWVRGYDCTVRNCDVDIPQDRDGAGAAVLAVNAPTHPTSPEGVAYLEETRVDGLIKAGTGGRIVGSDAGDAQRRVPAGVPRDPVEAASGGGAGTTHTLSIEDAYPSRPTDYRLAVSGDLAKSDAGNATIDANDSVDGATAEGRVWGGTDAYSFTGEVTDFWVDRPVTVYLDGEAVDPAVLAGLPSNVVAIHGESEKASYELAVSGDLAKSVDAGATIDDHDAIDGNTATGHVWGGTDAYRFSGEVTSFAADAPVTVEINGEEVQTPIESTTWHDLHVASAGNGEKVNYQFSVSGDLETTETVDAHETIDGSTVTGVMRYGADDYRFTGELLSFEADGEIVVEVDGEPVSV